MPPVAFVRTTTNVRLVARANHSLQCALKTTSALRCGTLLDALERNRHRAHFSSGQHVR